MPRLTILNVVSGDAPHLAVLPQAHESNNSTYLVQIAHLLFGNHVYADQLRNVVLPGSPLGQKGATHHIYVCFLNGPDGGVTKWMNALNQYIPEGWVAITSGVVFPGTLAAPQAGAVDIIAVAVVRDDK